MFQVFLQLWAKSSRASALVILFLVVHCLFGLSNMASAEEQPLWDRVAATIYWDRVKGWDVRVDTTLGNGCFAATIYEEGTAIRIGINPKNDNGYILLGNEKWKSLDVGKDYNIKLKFDDEPPWEGSARGVEFGGAGITFLWIDFDNIDLFTEFMRKNVLQVFYNKKKVATLNLAGSYAASVAVAECQKAMEAVTPMPSNEKDPFASDAGYKADPFAR